MNQNSHLAEASYPPAPWHSSGHFYMGLFETNVASELPAGLTRLFNPRWVVITLVRYLEGTLRYDELVFGGLARLGARPGIYVYAIWVNDLSSLWGGRRIWGLQKEMADFAWSDDGVRVADEQGIIAALTVRRGRQLIPAWMPMPGIGRLDEQWTYTVASAWTRLGTVQMHLSEWSERFPYHPEREPVVSFAADFRMKVPPPKLIQG